jgi:hypothetical protein
MQMEVNGLAVSKAALHAVNDAELKKMTEAGIMSTEARIKGFQQFVSENGILSGGM